MFDKIQKWYCNIENGIIIQKTKNVSSGYFYILVIKEYEKWLKMIVKPTETNNTFDKIRK